MQNYFSHINKFISCGLPSYKYCQIILILWDFEITFKSTALIIFLNGCVVYSCLLLCVYFNVYDKD